MACLIGLGIKPRCGLESQSTGTDRLRGIFDLLCSCGTSIHDLSRMGLSGALKVPRFNMPFELGLAYALQCKGGQKSGSRHKIFVFDEKERRVGSALSDMAGFDPKIHRGTADGMLYALLDCFDPQPGPIDEKKLMSLMSFVSGAVLQIQQDQHTNSPFRLNIFRQTVLLATERAKAEGLIPL